MKISAIIAVWNGETYVKEAIQSVLTQTLPAHELIVVDDGSTDQTAAMVRSFPQVKLIQQVNAGTGPARNSGVNAATGDWLAFLDHDDLWVPDKLATQTRWVHANPGSCGVLGLIENFISPELSEDAKSMIACPPGPLPGYSPSVLTIRRDRFLETGGWPASEREGVEWFVHARELGVKFVEIPQVLVQRRLHQSNRTRLGVANNLDYVRVARGLIARRRSQQPPK